jgi:hypothetical protein
MVYFLAAMDTEGEDQGVVVVDEPTAVRLAAACQEIEVIVRNWVCLKVKILGLKL